MSGQILSDVAYSSKDVFLIIGGLTVVGFGESEKFTLSKDGDLVMPKVGVDGDVSLAISNKRSGTLSFNLTNQSPTNGVLETYVAQGFVTKKVAFAVAFEDASGSGLSTTGWIQSVPDYVAGEGVEERTWVIGVANAITSPSAVSSAALNAIESISTI